MKPPLRVLIVDDDNAILASLCAFLEDEGFTVQCTSNARRALEILAESETDVAIIDVRLEEISGEKLILEAQKLLRTPRFVIYTGSLDYQISNQLLAVGIRPTDVLFKPVRDLRLLAEHIGRLFGKERGNGNR
jgi:DNA-binding NtrC family response regulator